MEKREKAYIPFGCGSTTKEGMPSVPRKELLEFRPLSFLSALTSFPLRNPHT